MTADSRRVLGFGLLLGAAGVTVIMLAWLVVSGVQAGGFVLGLLLLFVLAGPLAGAGWYVLARGRTEALEEQAFVGKRRVVDADRLFRAELTAQLRQLAQTPGLPRESLLRIADNVERAAADEAAWFEAIQLGDAQAATLTQYDDLAWERVRWLRDHAAEPPAVLADAVSELQVALDQRSDLLLRGRLAPAMAPGALLHAREPVRGAAAVAALALGDAVTHDGTDYLVEGLATSFSDGRTSKLAHLVPSSAGPGEHWLWSSPGGLEFGWLLAIASPPEVGSRQLAVDGAQLDLVDTRSSIATVVTTAGSAPGVLVRSWTYRSGEQLGLVEQWPDQSVHTYAGRIISANDLDVWPAAAPSSSA